MTHLADASNPHVLHAVAALASLRQARAWLLDAPTAEAQPGLRRTAAPRELTTRAAGRADRLLRTERAERTVTDIPTTSHPTPVRPALVDAQTDVHETAVYAAWIVASALRHRPLLVLHHQARRLWGDPWAAAVLQLHAGVPWLVCDCPPRVDGRHRGGCLDVVARDVGGMLARAGERARRVLGVGPAWVPIPGRPCPRCGRCCIEAEVSADDEREWIARCGNGCWIATVEQAARQHGRLADLLALIRSVRRQGQKRARRTA